MTTTLQHVVFPQTKDPDVLPLYADPETWTEVDETPVRLSEVASIDSVLSRESTRVRAGERVSYASYFNAFPASYWQRWTTVTEVTLRLQTEGTGTILVYRSNASGAQQRVDSALVTGKTDTEFTLPLTMFGDGGWLWFDLVAGDADLKLVHGSWTTEATPVTEGKLSLGMTTFNKADYCVVTLRNIAANPTLLENLDRIFLVDQGSKQVADEPGFDEIAAQLGDKLQLIVQPNIGGSGGFSRSMAETLKREDTDFLLLLDDDIEFETESALRALQFGRFSRNPVIVGGHMFDLLDKPVMHAWAEVVRNDAFVWGPSFPEQHRHDFRKQNLRQTPWMHSRLDADYNGWWMCMIPKKVIADIGLSIPVFIKWDDAEYGLRAKAAGYRTVSLPGVALWHVSWLDKDDTQDWQSFFHTRNRIVAGLLHATPQCGRGMLKNLNRINVKQLLNMQYYAVQLAVDGMRSVLAGPEQLHATMAQDMPAARAAAKDYPETRVYRTSDVDAPTSSGGRALPHVGERPEAFGGAKLALFTAKRLPKAWLRKSSETKAREPELEYAKRDAFWWTIPQHESVIVGSADGAGKMWYRHDQAKFRRLLREATQLNRKIVKDWDRLAAEYRAAMPRLTTPEEWQATFEGR